MKDMVANRNRVDWYQKWKLGGLALRENGFLWCAQLAVYYAASTIAERAFGAMDRRRRERKLPGLNSAALNRQIWNSWDWSRQGEEWTVSEAWRQSLVRLVMRSNIPPGASVLEIGPGAGRWTEPLLEDAREYVGIDISSAAVNRCAERFSKHSQARFSVGSGQDLAGVATQSIDAIWSFDVFVHINTADVDRYLAEFVRVLRPGGVAVIHHGGVGGASGGWRSDLTIAAMHEMTVRHGLLTAQTLSSWTDGGEVHDLGYGDLISVVTKR
jgi:ubiquinone/menaquinone biosynthesis C-methylase UbiE